MRKTKLIKHAFSVFVKELLIKAGACLGHCYNPPQDITFRVTHTCNSRCMTCDYWKSSSDPHELTADAWKNMLSQASKWVRPCHIIFTGGEPFVKKGFCEILKYAKDLGFYISVNTNGIVFDKKGCDEIFGINPDFIVFSLNSIKPEIHNKYKRVANLHQRVVAAIEYRKNKETGPLIGVTSIITKDNYRNLGDFVDWLNKLGVKSIDFGAVRENLNTQAEGQPAPHALESNVLWQIDDIPALNQQIGLLISKKKSGLPITTPFHDLNMLRIYFKNPENLPGRKKCKIGFRKLIIFPAGEVKLCYHYPPVGNVRDKTLKDIWFSEEARKQRTEMLKCNIACVVACLREYSFSEKFRIFLTRFRARKYA